MANEEVDRLGNFIKSQEETSEACVFPYPGFDLASGSSLVNDISRDNILGQIHLPEEKGHQQADTHSWKPKPSKVVMEDPNAEPLELLSQIQMYATTEYVSSED